MLCPDEGCRATVGGSVRVPQVSAVKAKTFKLRAVTKELARGQRAKIAVRLPATAITAIHRALKARGATSAALQIRAVGAAQNATSGRPLGAPQAVDG